MELVDESQRGIAQLAARRLGNGERILPQQRHAATRRYIKAAQQMQQRALARTRGPDDGNRLSGIHFEVDITQYLYVDLALPEGLAQPATAQHDLTHSATPPPD